MYALSCTNKKVYSVLDTKNMEGFNKTSCIILSGGFSSRMNLPKAHLKYSETENFLQHIINVYRKTEIEKIVVVVNFEVDIENTILLNRDITFITNCFPEKGRLYSIQLALKYLETSNFCLIQNIDSPFVNSVLINQLLLQKKMADYIAPVFNNKGGHPIIISKKIIDAIKAESNFDMSLKDILGNYTRFKIETNDNSCLVNINTPTDYLNWFNQPLSILK